MGTFQKKKNKEKDDKIREGRREPEKPDRVRRDEIKPFDAYYLFFHVSMLLAASSEKSSSLLPPPINPLWDNKIG